MKKSITTIITGKEQSIQVVFDELYRIANENGVRVEEISMSKEAE